MWRRRWEAREGVWEWGAWIGLLAEGEEEMGRGMWIEMVKVRCAQVGARNNVSDMEKDPFYNFIEKTYPIHPMLLAAALYAVGGFPYIVWGMVRVVAVYEEEWCFGVE